MRSPPGAAAASSVAALHAIALARMTVDDIYAFDDLLATRQGRSTGANVPPLNRRPT